jgi:hypothetical protein
MWVLMAASLCLTAPALGFLMTGILSPITGRLCMSSLQNPQDWSCNDGAYLLTAVYQRDGDDDEGEVIYRIIFCSANLL